MKWGYVNTVIYFSQQQLFYYVKQLNNYSVNIIPVFYKFVIVFGFVLFIAFVKFQFVLYYGNI
jgi:hypothetical protein